MTTSHPIYDLPTQYWDTIQAQLETLGFSFQQPGKLAAAVLKLSDHYNQGRGSLSPWQDPAMQAAYLAYFLPLNTMRLQSIWDECRRRNFLAGLDHAFDFGTGLGAVQLGFDLSANRALTIDPCDTSGDQQTHTSSLKFSVFDHDREALKLQELFFSRLEIEKPRQTLSEAEFVQAIRDKLPQSLIAFSYVWTEIENFPSWALSAEALMIVEPSTAVSSRKLSSLREHLKENGFSLWAPCTHQEKCPMLSGERDWCHSRIHIETPDFWQNLEALLPMKNRTLTYSYLLARKTKSPMPAGLSRAVGDVLEEKGRNRLLVCRNQDPQFMQWMPQRFSKEDLQHLQLRRGDLLRLSMPDSQFKNGIWKLTRLNEIEQL